MRLIDKQQKIDGVTGQMRNLVTATALSLVLAGCGGQQSSDAIDGASENVAEATDQSASLARYDTVTYTTTETFEEDVLNSDVPVLVDFTAVWCIPCKVVDPIVVSLMPEMAGRARVFKLDIDDDPEIYEMLNVNGVPHILFFKNGVEQERIISPQPREIYVEYLEALIADSSTLSVSLKLLDDDPFRRHYILTKSIDVLKQTVAERPDLLTAPFETGQTPISTILNKSSVRQNDQIEYALTLNPEISTRDLVGLGRCDEFVAAIEEDPEALNRPDAEGVTPIELAMRRARRLGDNNCVRDVLDSNPDLTEPDVTPIPLNRTAVLRGDIDLFNELLDRGMSAETVNDDGFNALHWAVYYRNEQIVNELVKRGIRTGMKTNDGKTALDIALEGKNRRAEALNDESVASDPQMVERVNMTVAQYDRIIATLESAS